MQSPETKSVLRYCSYSEDIVGSPLDFFFYVGLNRVANEHKDHDSPPMKNLHHLLIESGLFVHGEEIPAVPYRSFQNEKKLEDNDLSRTVFKGNNFGTLTAYVKMEEESGAAGTGE
ncbi:hypothetical protein Tco_0642205 [Tanacetum coccineum]